MTGRPTVNWQSLERVEFKTLEDIWNWAGLGAALSRNTGLIVMQARHDFHDYMKDMSSTPNNANRRASRVTNHINKVSNHLSGMMDEFKQIPPEILKVYEPEITAARRKGKPKIDLSK